jgi:hypothetical protein
MLKSLLLISKYIVFVYILHVVVFVLYPSQHHFGLPLQMLAECTVICTFYYIYQLFYGGVALQILSYCRMMALLSLMLLCNGIQRPIDNLQSVSIIISFEIGPNVFVDPYFLQHCMQLFFNIDVILEAKLDLLLSL